MVKLLLLRHGKSDWSAACAGDHERPLTARGQRAAAVMGRFLAICGQEPALTIASSAVRARTTAEIAARSGGWSCRLEVSESLYLASPPEVLELVRQLGGEAERVLVVGHEPTCSQLLALLTAGSQVRFPTAALACVELQHQRWEQARPAEGLLLWLVTPKLVQPLLEQPPG